MKIKRTANAGILLELDGVTILLDGVCREVAPYPATPPQIAASLMACPPDLLAFTHYHDDHYDPDFATQFQSRTGRVILGPGPIPGCHVSLQEQQLGTVTVLPVQSRHLGKAGKDTPHVSYVIQGSQCLWFLGDSSPLLWQGREDLPRPDVLVVPYAYAATEKGWQVSLSLKPKYILLLHLPPKNADEFSLWQAVESVTAGHPILIPEMGKEYFLNTN